GEKTQEGHAVALGGVRDRPNGGLVLRGQRREGAHRQEIPVDARLDRGIGLTRFGELVAKTGRALRKGLFKPRGLGLLARRGFVPAGLSSATGASASAVSSAGAATANLPAASRAGVAATGVSRIAAASSTGAEGCGAT